MRSSKTAELSSFSDLCKTALESSVALWPLFFIRAAFLVANLLFFGLCAVICCYPLVQFFVEHLDDVTNGNMKSLMAQADFTSFFSNGSTWVMLAAMGAFYIATAWFFFAFYDSGVYSELRSNQKMGELFNWKKFFDKGIQFTFPMMGLEILCVVAFIAYMLISMVLGVLVVGIFHFLPGWIGFVAIIPAGVLVLLGFMLLFAGAGLAGVFLVEGDGVFESFQKGISRALGDRGRVIWLFIIVILIYLVFYIACNVVFSVLGLLPLIGLVFKLILFVINVAFSIGLNIYLDSLCVAVTLESRDVD